jgi:hypothetical protein
MLHVTVAVTDDGRGFGRETTLAHLHQGNVVKGGQELCTVR